MSFANPNEPNLPDFTTFVYGQGVPAADLPSTSQYLQWTFTLASGDALVPPGDMPAILYVLAVYNLGMHQLIKMAKDIDGQTFFTDTRKTLSLNAFSFGVVTSTGDNADSTTLTVPDWLKDATLQTLDLLRTPWGREYVQYAQSYGPNIVGVS